MANVISTLLKLNATDFKTGLKSAQQSIKETDGVVSKAKAGWGAAFASFASSPVAIGAATAAVGTFAAASISAASDLEESVNAVNVTFGDSADKILEFGENAARTVGLATAEFNQLATPLGAILKNTGIDIDEVADKTILLTQRSADLASVFNKDVSTAVGAIQAGLRGELDPLEQFGVKLSAATVEQRALADSGKESARQLTEQEKALARIEIILDQTDQAAGDFANTQDSLANQTRVLNAEFTNLKAKVGAELVPILSDFAGLLLDIEENAGKAKDAIEQIPGGEGLLDALGTNLFELPKKSKEQWDDLGRSIGIVPDKVGKLGTFRAVLDSIIQGTRDAEAGVTDLGNATETAAGKADAYGVSAEGTNRALDRLAFPQLAEDLRQVATAAEEAGDGFNVFEDGLQKSADQVSFLTSELNKLDEDLNAVKLLKDIEEQFARITADAEDQQGEVIRLTELVADYVGTLDGLSTQKVTEIIAVLRSGDVERIRALMDELTADKFVNLTIVPKIAGFESLNAQFAAGRIPTAPTFTNQTSTAQTTDARTIINYFPVGSTPTTQFVDQQTDIRRNGTRLS